MVALPEGVDVIELRQDEPRFDDAMRLAASILDQDRYLVRAYPHAAESHVLAAFRGSACVGFLRFLIQIIGADEGRPPVPRHGTPLTEGYVEAFGVDPAVRRVGVGTALQTHAIEYCRSAGCYQMRSRSPVTSAENHALKIAAGYVLSPSEQNDSYYFLLKL